MGDLAGRTVTVVGINYAPEPTGIAPYTTALAHALSQAGAAVHVITGLPHYPQWSIDDPRFASGSYFSELDGAIRVTRCRHHVPQHPDLVGRLRLEATFLAHALPMVLRDRSDLVITVTPSLAGMAAGVLGRKRRPVSAIVQDLTGNAASETGAAKAWVGGLISRVEHGLLRRCRRVGVITPDFGVDLMAAGVDRNALIDLPNFTHIQPLDVATVVARRQLGWDLDRFMVVHTGNMGAKQGLLAVVDAARLAQQQQIDLDFVLVGDGNQRQALEAAAAGVTSLRIVPPVSSEHYPLVLAAADVLLVNELPGVRQMSLPSKLTSYAASGKPILAAVDPTGITAEFLRRTVLGYAVQAGSAEDLLAAAQILQADPRLVEALSASSRRVYRGLYDKTAAYRRYVDFALEAGGFDSIDNQQMPPGDEPFASVA